MYIYIYIRLLLLLLLIPPQRSRRSRITGFHRIPFLRQTISDYARLVQPTTFSRRNSSVGENRGQLLVHRWRCTREKIVFPWRKVLLLNSRGSSADKTRLRAGTRRTRASSFSADSRVSSRARSFLRLPYVFFPTFGNETFLPSPFGTNLLTDRH